LFSAVSSINEKDKDYFMKKTAVATLFAALILVLSVSIIAVSLHPATPTASTSQQYSYTIINTYHHDSAAFTEGLDYSDGYLYESTGLSGKSSLRCTNLASGVVEQEVTLSAQFFGEGIAVVGDSIIQLTYQSHIGFVYDKATFQVKGNFSYSTEGWGLTYDGTRLIMSDGSSNLYFLDPVTFQRIGQIQVHDGNTSVSKLNELEYINGDVYANIFQSAKIAVINPQTGAVKAWIDLTGLQTVNSHGSESVLNGIAYDAQNNRLFVTGKNWSNLYEIKLVPATSPE
jgi:glutamine cyclotransferase